MSPSALSLFVRTHTVRATHAAADPGLSWFRTGAPHEELNGVLGATAERIDEAAAALDGVPALWHSWPEHPRLDIERALAARGLEFVEEEPLMALDLHSGGAAPAGETAGAAAAGFSGHTGAGSGRRSGSPASIRLVDDQAGLATWASVWLGETPDAGVLAALSAAGLGRERAVHHLLAESDGVAVGCGAAVIAGDAMAVEHIVTSAPNRGRGIGTALTAAALARGRELGARTAVLTASPDGASIYRHLGFSTVDTVRRWALPEAATR